MEGYRRVDEWHLIERAIDNFDVVFLRNEDSVAQMGRGRLTREELAVLELVNGKNTVKDIIRKSRMGSFEVARCCTAAQHQARAPPRAARRGLISETNNARARGPGVTKQPSRLRRALAAAHHEAEHEARQRERASRAAAGGAATAAVLAAAAGRLGPGRSPSSRRRPSCCRRRTSRRSRRCRCRTSRRPGRRDRDDADVVDRPAAELEALVAIELERELDLAARRLRRQVDVLEAPLLVDVVDLQRLRVRRAREVRSTPCVPFAVIVAWS